VGVAPPDLVDCTVEKVAINAVMAGCRPEYLPVVLAAVEACCTSEFNGHGLLATTYFSGPVVIVNGPVRRAIGMNSGVNALGQGTRANLAVGRPGGALQHPENPALGGRDDGQPIGPPPVEDGLGLVLQGAQLHAPRPQPRAAEPHGQLLGDAGVLGAGA